MTRAWMQTLTGRTLTMARPDPREIDLLVDLPETLARVCRFNGAVPGGILSVAQHSVTMADAVLDETGDANLAAIALLDNAHEYIWGDLTTPAVEGLQEIADELFGPVEAGAIPQTIAVAKERANAAIFKACGLPWPPTEAQARIVKGFDLRLLATEKRQVLATCGRRWSAAVERAEPLRLRGGITLWPIARAADEYRKRLRQLCPALLRKP